MKTVRERIKAIRRDWEVVSIGAHKFWKVPSDQLLRKPLPDEAFALLPITFIEDDKMEFPGSPPLQGAGPYVSSGVAVHTIGYDEEWDFDRRTRLDEVRQRDFEIREDHVLDGSDVTAAARGARIIWKNEPATNLTARTMVMFSELDWYGECFQVLEAHGWTRYGQISSGILGRIDEHFDQHDDELRSWLADQHRYDEEERKLYFLEIAATLFAPPLSRLWYAASMLSLYYLHHDDLRVGFLWAEYQMKMRFEMFALKQMEAVERNRENGAKGGQAEKKRDRYRSLDQLARANFKDFAFASDRQAVKRAKELAAAFDKEAEEPLFYQGGKLLRDEWFDDWLAAFRLQARGVE